MQREGRLVHPSDRPGLGIEIDLDVVRAHPFQQEEPRLLDLLRRGRRRLVSARRAAAARSQRKSSSQCGLRARIVRPSCSKAQ